MKVISATSTIGPSTVVNSSAKRILNIGVKDSQASSYQAPAYELSAGSSSVGSSAVSEMAHKVHEVPCRDRVDVKKEPGAPFGALVLLWRYTKARSA